MNFLKKYTKKRAKAIKILLKTPQKKWKVETFHQLRVEIKKLHALLTLIKFCDEDFKAKKQFLPFKLIFKQAGIIREFQLHEKIIEKYFDNTFFKDYQHNTNQLLAKAEKDFFALINKKTIAEIEKKYEIIFEALPTITKKKSNAFVAGKNDFIQKKLSQSPLQTTIAHDLRKEIKILNNIKGFLGLELDTDLNNLATLLGEWHDNDVFMAFLQEKISSAFSSRKSLQKIKNIINKISPENTFLFDNINQWIKEHIIK